MPAFAMIPFALSLALASPVRVDLTTTGKRSGYTKTGRLDEVQALCERVRAAGQGCEQLATSPEGRPLTAWILSSIPAADDVDGSRRRARPVLAFVAGIHAGEIDGKDALAAVMQDVLNGVVEPGLLEQVTLVVVPVYNVDGHERFGAWQRPNQRGPEEMGWRVTAQNLNLNRDWVKADAPETRALLALWSRWDPAVVVDLHVTDGAKFQHDVALVVEPSQPQQSPLSGSALALRDVVVRDLKARGHLPLDFYPAFEVDDDPASGFVVGVTPGRLTHGYAALRDRIGLLVETHSWRTYKERVTTTIDVLTAVLHTARSQASSWVQQERAIDAGHLAGDLQRHDVVLTWQPDGAPQQIPFLGYAYTKTPSEISGALWTRYDERTPQTWTVPLVRGSKPATTTTTPGYGYVVPPAFADDVELRLRAHGLVSTRLSTTTALPVGVFRATDATFGSKPYEGRQTAKVQGSWATETRTLPRNSLLVPLAQQHARLVVELLEPLATDSLTSWGLFNAMLEQKEYMEDYVAEEEARRMLAKDPALRDAFARKLHDDAAFAKEPAARLRFFYQRHPSWDERCMLLPVMRVDVDPRASR